LFPREWYPDAPVVDLFEYFYRPPDSDLDFRPDVPSTEATRLRATARNAMILVPPIPRTATSSSLPSTAS